MADITSLAAGGTSGVAGGDLLYHEIDIADFVTAGGTTTQTARVVYIPADSFFELHQVEVVTALSLGAGARIDVGDSADDDEFVTNASTLTAGTNLTLLKNAGTPGTVYTAADELNVKITGGTIASGVLRFVYTLRSTERNAIATTITP